MSRRLWRVYVEDILESIGYIETYVEGMKYKHFQEDRKTMDAVVRNFEIIGEASKFIPDEMRKKHAQIDWTGIVGLRNRIAHEYFAIDPEIMWNILKEELPPLKRELQKLLERERP